MKNKNILKFLTVLISFIIITNSNNYIFSKVDKSTTLEKNVNEQENFNKDEEIKPITKEEWEKEEKEKYEIWQQNMKAYEKNDKEMEKENFKTYKNLNIKKFEHPDYNLKAYRKNGVIYLVYEHKITKTKIVIIPIKNLKNYKVKDGFFTKDNYYFRAFVPDDSGLVHFAEHCFVTDILDYEANKDKNIRAGFNATTKPFGLIILLTERNAKFDFTEKLIKELGNPKLLKNDALYERERGRIIYEMTEFEKEKELYDSYKKSSEKEFNIGGDTKELAKMSKERVRDFFKNTLHPSNLLITKHVPELDYEYILKYLTLLNDKYLSHYEYKEFESPYPKLKKDYYYLKEKYIDNSNGGTIRDLLLNKKECKYWARIDLLNPSYNKDDKKTAWKHPALYMPFGKKDGINKIKLELEEFVKKLGYEGIKMGTLAGMTLYGNKKELFEKEALEKTYKKINNFAIEKIKTLTEKDIERNLIDPPEYNQIKNENVEDIQPFFSSPIFLKTGTHLDALLQQEFLVFNNIFTNEILEITEKNGINEIIDSKQSLINKYKKDIENLGKFLKDKKPSKILVKEQGKPINGTEKYKNLLKEFNKPFYIPLELKKNKKTTLEFLAKNYLESFMGEMVLKKVIQDDTPYAFTCVEGSYIAMHSSIDKKYTQEELNYFKNEFRKDLKNQNITEQDFKDLKTRIKKDFEHFNEYVETTEKHLKTAMKSIDYYLKHGLDENAEVYDEKKGGFKIDNKTTRGDLFYEVCCLQIMFKTLEESNNYEKKYSNFIKKYGQKNYEKYKPILIDKNFVKELKEELIIPLIEAFHYRNSRIKEFLKEMDNVKFKDFVETVKSCDLVSKEKYEKDQKIADDFREQNIFLKV